MIDESLLSLVRCPIDGQELLVASDELTAALNRQIDQRQLRDHVDAIVDEPLDGALVTRDGSRAYPVRECIPTLIPAESIPLTAELQEWVQQSPA